MAAVLDDCLRILRDERRPGRARDEIRWISSDDLASPFTFGNVCQTLGLDPDAVRAAVLRRARVDDVADGWRGLPDPGRRRLRPGQVRVRHAPTGSPLGTSARTGRESQEALQRAPQVAR